MKRHTVKSIVLMLFLSSIGQILHPAIAGLALLVCLANASFAAEASPPSGIFEWKGRFSDGTPAGRPGGEIWNRIEGGWNVKVQAKLECEAASPPGVPASLQRLYSIKSVFFKIPFQYLAFPIGSLSNPVAENYLVVLGSSDFDLSYPPNFDGIPYPNTMYNGSWIAESYDAPTPGAYSYQIFLKFRGLQVFETPKGATLTIEGAKLTTAGVDPCSGGGFFINHFSYLPEAWSFWPAGSDFVSPSGYDGVYTNASNPKDFRTYCSLQETEALSLSKGVRFLDEEDESRVVVGAVADGRSRVVVELNGVQSSADVTIPDSDGTWVSGPTLLNGVWRRTWQAPESYGGSDDDNTQRKRPIGFAIVVDGKSIAPSPFNLYKAPVVMLHGIWSNASIWSSLQEALSNDGFLFVHAESYPYQASFSDNSLVTQNHVVHALAEAQHLDLVAKKADIVAHSMGGCLAKMRGSNNEYIRRIVTVGTPHYGSPVANRALEFDETSFGALEFILSKMKRSLYSGAVEDLREGVCDIPGNNLGVPVLAIKGIVEPTDGFPMFSLANGYINLLRIILVDKLFSSQQQLHEDLFGTTDTSDWVVSGTSQIGGLLAESMNVDVTWHVDEAANSDFIKEVVDFLDAPSDSVSATLSQQAAPLAESQPLPAQPFVWQVASSALASGGITITAPAAGTVFSPGDTMHVAVSTPPTATGVLVALSDGPVVVDDTALFEMDIPILQGALGVMTIGALAWDANEIIGTASTTVTVKTTATVTSLKVWPDSVLYLNAGETVPFVVHGVFSDGIERDITTSQCGTTYNTTDSSVASIDAAGVLTAKAAGYCCVIVSNGDSMQIPVLVQAPSPPVIGDFHPADKNSDEVIGISEIVSYINDWAAGEVSISDVVKAINLWAAGHYYWDSSDQKFKPGTQP